MTRFEWKPGDIKVSKPEPQHIGVGCGREIEVTVPTRFSCKLVKTRCGSTGIHGYPQFCDTCAPKYADRDWRREAIEAGENFDDDY